MKSSLLILIVTSLMIIGCSKSVDESTLIEKNGLMYQSDSDKPYSGEVFDLYDTGENFFTGVFEQGTQVGEFVYYRKDGTVQEPLNFQDIVKTEGKTYSPNSSEPFSGEVVGLYTTGEKVLSGVFVSGNQVGDYTYFKKDGSIQEPLNYKDIIIKDGLIYPPNSDEPFSGEVVGLYSTGEFEFSSVIRFGTQVEKYSFYNRDGSMKVPINSGTLREGGPRTFNQLFHILDVGDYLKPGLTDILYTVDTNEPYSGPVFTLWNGETQMEGTLIKGLLNGPVGSFMYSKRDGEINFQNGLLNGTTRFWDSLDSTIVHTSLSYKDGIEHGTHISTWNGKQKRMLSSYSNGNFDGIYTEWYESGQKSIDGFYLMGNRDGLWRKWYENGVIREEVTWKDGGIVKPNNFYFESGDTIQPINFDDLGLYDTYWGTSEFFLRSDNTHKNGYTGKTYRLFENGNKEFEGLIYEGEVNGYWTYYHENGEKSSQGVKVNKNRNGLWTQWYENGQQSCEVNYKNGVKDGLYTWWYGNGQQEEKGVYKNGEQDSLWTYHYENGQKSREVNYKSGVRDGLFTNWFENGQKSSEGSFKNGVRDSLFTWWFENGQNSSEGNYKNGEQDSIWSDWIGENRDKTQTDYRGDEEGRVTGFFESGEKYSEGFIKDGKKDGHWKKWYKNGNMLSDLYRKSGDIVGHYTRWYENGQKMREGEYKDNKKVGEWKEWEEDGTPK